MSDRMWLFVSLLFVASNGGQLLWGNPWSVEFNVFAVAFWGFVAGIQVERLWLHG